MNRTLRSTKIIAIGCLLVALAACGSSATTAPVQSLPDTTTTTSAPPVAGGSTPPASPTPTLTPGKITGKGKAATTVVDGKAVTCKQLVRAGKQDCDATSLALFTKYGGGMQDYLDGFRDAVDAGDYAQKIKTYGAGLTNTQMAFLGLNVCQVREQGLDKKAYVSFYEDYKGTAQEFKPLLGITWDKAVAHLCT